MNILHPFMDKVLSEDMMKKNNEMGGNIPRGDFPGGFSRREFDGRGFSGSCITT